MKLFRVITILVLAAAMTLPVFAGGQQDSGTPGTQTTARAQRFELLGAGATFPAPLITAWADDYRDVTNGQVTVNYQSIGSGGGIRQFLEQTIMFGASERSLTDEQMEDIKNLTGGLAFNMPITLGDVVPTYNLPGIEKGLVFSAETIAGAFLGEITRWNDPKIAALNPGVNLPNLPIQIAHRSDGSGTTAVFTDYLTKVNSTWANQVGFGSSVNWPVGSGGNGNEGVAGIVQNTPGALGYNSLVYAVLNDIAYGSVINKSGNTIVPSLEATSLSAAVDIPLDGRVSLTDTDAPQGYPIAGFAWALVHENLDQNAAITNIEDARQVTKFLYWIVTEGQNINESLSFARLPQDAQEIAVRMVSSLKYEGQPVGQQVIDQVRTNGF
ncbi:phosphate ABC transporter substrate-binding protein PstS [Spirochaeta dissipatitropha]